MNPNPNRPSVWSVAVRAAVVVLTVWVVVPVLMGTVYTWNAPWEASPATTDPIGEGAQRIRDLKENLRKRLATELNIGTSGPDDGRLRAGAARVFVSATAPTVLNGPGDLTTSTALDAGRVWVDTSTTPPALKYYTGAAWVAPTGLGVVPANGIILWDQPNGDSDCDGALDDPNACPCGYTRADEFQYIGPRGADVTGGNGNIPDAPGVTCSDYTTTYGTGCGASSPSATYSDTPALNTLYGHSHTIGVTDVPGPGTGNTGIGASTTVGTGPAGGGEAWQHPFRTVLFCRKS